MKKTLPWALLAASALWAFAAPASAQEQVWTGEQVKAAWAGKKVFARGPAGLVDFFLRADGTASVSVGNMVDSGTWRGTESGYCAKWQKIRAGEERCFKVVQRGNTVSVLNPDGSLSAEILKVTD